MNDSINGGMDMEVTNEYAGTITVSRDSLPRKFYSHQKDALYVLNKMTDKSRLKGMLVLPTGGGKTFTAMIWALKNAIDQDKKVLWIAHRHELLNQAAETMVYSSYSDILLNRKSYSYRIISGMHDKPVNIHADDDFLIASKDSLNHGMGYLKQWIDYNRNNIVLIIDEAHHATARSYRNIINLLDSENPEWFQMLGLTATPLRTAEEEQGILGSIFRDGILYGIDLKTLISRKILADPVFEELKTKVDIANELTDRDIKNIQAFDNLPQDMAEKIAKDKNRNNLIVNYYTENKSKYGQTLLFAIDVNHAIELNALFNQRGIPSEFIVSNIKDMFTKVTISNKDNDEKIKKYKDGEIKVLINVNILTEGTDLPKTQTVFLTRPTVSTVLMTQMVGRALRGLEAGGTEIAYIVSFIDNWNDKIAWVNPEALMATEAGNIDKEYEKKERITKLIAISKIEELTRIMDQTVDTTKLESIHFIERVPVGVYSFSILTPPEDGDENTKNCVIIVYDSFRQAYEDFINDLDIIFKEKKLDNKEFLEDYELAYLCDYVKRTYFEGYYNPINYKEEDIKDILRYYALKEAKPIFLSFENRKNFDLANVARYIDEKQLAPLPCKQYLDSLWNDPKNFYQLFFGHSYKYFISQIDNEVHKLTYPEIYQSVSKMPENRKENVDVTKLPLAKIKEIDMEYWRSLTNTVYNKAKDKEGFYHSAGSNFKSKHKGDFQIDHIKPMSKGGLTEPENLQLLTIHENMTKSDNIITELNALSDKLVVGPDTLINTITESKVKAEKDTIADLDTLYREIKDKSVNEIKECIYNVSDNAKFEDLIQLCDKAIQLHPEISDFHRQKAELLYNHCKNKEALNSIDLAIQSEPENSENYYFRGTMYFDSNKYRKSIEDYKKISKENSLYIDALNQIGRCLMCENNHKEASDIFKKIITLDPTYLYSYWNLAETYQNLNELDKVNDYYNKALECCTNKIKQDSNEDNAELYIGRAGILFDLGKYDDALMDLLKVLQVNPKRTYVNFLIAQCCLNKGQTDEALQYFDKELINDPYSIEAYNGKADLLLSLKQYDEALELYKKVIELDPSAKSYYNRGLLYLTEKQTNNALPDLLKATELDPTMEDAYFYIADAYDRKKNYDLAIQYYDKVIELSPKYGNAYNNKGWVFEKTKKYVEALKYYKRALEIDPQEKLYSRNIKRLTELMKIAKK